jgi:hypothetical protein
MKQFLKKAKAITILILVLSLTGCDKDDNNYPEVMAGFTYTLNADTGTVTFINISEKSRSYLWDFGDGGTSNEINPVKTYANGTYTVTLKAVNASGASATFEDTIIISIPNPITFPVTFDDPNVAYNVAVFSGASFEILDNPDVSGTNDEASKVGAITNSGAEYEGINFDLGTQLDLAAAKTITMNFWADAPVDVLMKLEQGTGPDIEVTASHGGTGWEVISFDFNSSDKYVRVTLFVDGPGTTAGTFYMDDIIQIETPPAACTPETTQSLDAADFNLTFQTDPTASITDAGAVMISVANPDPDNAVNSSCQVGKIDRNGGDLFANNQIEFDSKLDLNANAGFKIKVWSPVAGTNVLVKLEEKTNSGINVEVGATTTSDGTWEELTFDFASSESGKYDKIILFFELNTNTTETYYIDDFRLYERAGGGAVCTPETAESLSAASLNITFKTDQTANIIEDGGDFEWVSNPDFDNAVNSSCYVGKITKLGNNPWDNNQINLDAKLDFNANAGLKIKVWSAVAGFKVRIKLEDQANAGINTELEVTSTKTGEWEELTFPFASSESDKYDKIVIFFDLNANNADAYYFDDLMLYGTGGGGGAVCTPETAESLSAASLDITFKTDQTANIIEDGGDFEWASNPDFDNSVNSSCYVGKITKLGNNPWDNNQINLDAKLDFNANAGLKIKVWSAVAGFKVRIKLEDQANAGTNTELEVTSTKTGEWEELTFPFASSESDKYDKIVIFFDLNANNADTYYFDDLMLYGTGGGGGGGASTIVNGDFETGDKTGWVFFDVTTTNGGSVSVTNAESNGGTYSAKITSGQFNNPGIKQERFGAGTILPNTQYQVKLDSKVESLVDGAVVNVFAFSESAVDGDPAILHSLGTVNVAPGDWNSNTFTFTTGGTVSGGVSLLIEVVCGGATTCNGVVYIDNVSFNIAP